MNVLVTGGAGYVGSHAAKLLASAGHEVWDYDNLVFGHRAAVAPGRLIEGDLLDRGKVEAVLREQRIDAVMHFAAFAYVGESVTDPAKYYHNNVVGTLSLMEAMRAVGVSRIVFSSTCATYGEPEQVPTRESQPQRPINPYGFTKLVVQHALADYAHAYGGFQRTQTVFQFDADDGRTISTLDRSLVLRAVSSILTSEAARKIESPAAPRL